MFKGRVMESTVMKVLTRSKGRCENRNCRNSKGCQLHHVFFRSQYMKDDKHGAWNLANICYHCHEAIHHSGNRAGIELNLALKRLAYKRYKGDYKNVLQAILRRTEVNCKQYEERNKEQSKKISRKLLNKIGELS